MKRTMQLILSAALFATVTALPQAADAACEQSQLVGDYGFLATGNVIGQPDGNGQVDNQPYASGGLLSFRDDGTLSLVGTQSVNGVVSPVTPDEGEYAIGSNCKGAATIGGERFFDFVVVGNGERIEFIRSDVGVVITGYAKRKAASCTQQNVKGFYGYAFNAIVFNITIGNTFIPEALFAGGGTVGLDSKGHAVLDDTASFGGFVLNRHYEGTVEVDPDCTGSAVVTLPPAAPTTANPVHVDAVWVDNRKSVMLIQTDQGTYIAGEATRLQKISAP